MAAPDFLPKTVELLGYRAALICSRPDCRKLTVGPSKVANPLRLLIGEAAHICAAREGVKGKKQARFDSNISVTDRAKPENGIWLCANCHTLVDKNAGADFTAVELRKWKSDHEEAIRSLLLSQRSPFPFLRQYAIEGQVAQDIVNLFETRGMLFAHRIHEVDRHVVDSIILIRDRLDMFVGQVKHDEPLQKLIKGIDLEFVHVMNVTGNRSQNWMSELETLRNRVSDFLRILTLDYGCTVTGPLRSIL